MLPKLNEPWALVPEFRFVDHFKEHRKRAHEKFLVSLVQRLIHNHLFFSFRMERDAEHLVVLLGMFEVVVDAGSNCFHTRSIPITPNALLYVYEEAY